MCVRCSCVLIPECINEEEILAQLKGKRLGVWVIQGVEGWGCFLTFGMVSGHQSGVKRSFVKRSAPRPHCQG